MEAELKIPVASLQSGFCLEQLNGNEDVDGKLYYVEHQNTMDHKMEILAVEGERMKIQLTGVTKDVYYDGSAPKNKMQLVTWFDKEL